MTGPEVKPICELVGEFQNPNLPLTAATVWKLARRTSAQEAEVEGLGCFAKCPRGCTVLFDSGREFEPPADCKRDLGSFATGQTLAA